jgi:hypothetical protein
VFFSVLAPITVPLLNHKCAEKGCGAIFGNREGDANIIRIRFRVGVPMRQSWHQNDYVAG